MVDCLGERNFAGFSFKNGKRFVMSDFVITEKFRFVSTFSGSVGGTRRKVISKIKTQCRVQETLHFSSRLSRLNRAHASSTIFYLSVKCYSNSQQLGIAPLIKFDSSRRVLFRFYFTFAYFVIPINDIINNN